MSDRRILTIKISPSTIEARSGKHPATTVGGEHGRTKNGGDGGGDWDA